jgi:hypothetical protein
MLWCVPLREVNLTTLLVKGSMLWFDFLTLSVVSGQQASKREVLIQVRPVDAVGRQLNSAQLLCRPADQPRVAGYRKANLGAAFHCNYNLAVPEHGCTRAIG